MVRFDDDIAGTALGLNAYDIRLSDNWTINGIPNGGYLMAVLANAMPARHDLLIADAFPPPVFARQGGVAWIPTIELSVNIRAIPRTPWLHCRFRTRFVTAGLLEEVGEVWDADGNLVAVSRQIAQYRNDD
jgi:hypothetical protein